MKIKPSDRVELISGGPVMTIERIITKDGEEFADCVWREKQKTRRETFAVLSLRHHVNELPWVSNPRR
jgi:uncharacterized protein YodC (DUF2158 family)